MTGTPAGVGAPYNDFFKSGDIGKMEIEKIGPIQSLYLLMKRGISKKYGTYTNRPTGLPGPERLSKSKSRNSQVTGKPKPAPGSKRRIPPVAERRSAGRPKSKASVGREKLID